MIGLIIPPAEIKKFIETTAEHVAINGSEFEKMLTEREQHKPQFAFLKTDSPYRAYYDHKVAEISKKLLQGMMAEEHKEEIKLEIQEPIIKQQQPAPQQLQFLEKIFVELKEPDPQKYISQLPQKLPEGEQAIIQHTAQYSAKNGKNFLVALSERQKNNPQFQFLRTSSKHHGYFIKLVEAYTNVLEMSAEEMDRITKYADDRESILSRCKEVYEYHMAKQQQTRGKKEQTKQTKETNIDWNDFELVETITFDTDYNKNIASGQLIARIQRHAATVPKTMEETVISQPKKRQILQQCHVCRHNILASQMNKHLKTCLGQKKKNNTQQVNQGEEIDIRRNLEDLSLRRPDIFGTQDNLITLKEGEDQKNKAQEKVFFDGQNPKINRSTGSFAMLLYQQKKLKEEMEKNAK